MSAFPPIPLNDVPGRVFCPAFGAFIDEGLCWECSMAEQGGPADTEEELRRWVAGSGRFVSIADFQRVCAGCDHCPWREGGESGRDRERPLA